MKWPLALLFLSATAFADEAGTLRRRAHAYEQRGDWVQASAELVKLEKFAKAEALFGEAFASFQLADNAAAIALAYRAKELPGVYKDRATLLYGDALFRDGQVERAKSVYLAYRSTLKGDARAVAEKRVRACNVKLALPEAQDL